MSGESDIDRMVRERIAERQAQQRREREVLDFLEGAIDHAVGYVALPVVKGLQRAIGHCGAIRPVPARKGSRVFSAYGESPNSGIGIELVVHVNGVPQIVDDPRAVLYWLHIDGTVFYKGRARKRFSIEPAENRTGRPMPTEQFIAQSITVQVAALLDGR
jgi:hypothetical protein